MGRHVSDFIQGLLSAPWHLGTYRVLSSLIHYLGRQWPVQALNRFSGVREQRHSIWLPAEKNCSDIHRAVRGSSDDLAQVWPVVIVFYLGTVVGLKSISMFLARIIN